MAKRRVVVTGLGMLSPVGNTVDSSWKNILAGKSGIAPITSFDCSSFTTQFAGEVKNFDAEQYIPKKETKKMDRFIQLGTVAVSAKVETMAAANCSEDTENGNR